MKVFLYPVGEGEPSAKMRARELPYDISTGLARRTAAQRFAVRPIHAGHRRKKAGKVGFYTEEGRRIGEVQVGRYPHEIAFSPDHRFFYVTDNGMLWMTDPGAGGNTISIIDVRSRKKTGVIDLVDLRRPHGIAVVPQTGEIVVTIENPYGLLRIDPVTRKVVRRYDVAGNSPHMVDAGEWHRLGQQFRNRNGGCRESGLGRRGGCHPHRQEPAGGYREPRREAGLRNQHGEQHDLDCQRANAAGGGRDPNRHGAGADVPDARRKDPGLQPSDRPRRWDLPMWPPAGRRRGFRCPASRSRYRSPTTGIPPTWAFRIATK